MSAPQEKNQFEMFVENTQKWLAETWRKLPSQIIAAPGQTTKLVYTPMRWMGGFFQGVSGLTGLGGPSISGINLEQVSANLSNILKTTMNVLGGTGKGALHLATQTFFGVQKGAKNAASLAKAGAENTKQAAATTAAAMQSSAAGLGQFITKTGGIAIDALKAVFLSGQTPAYSP